MTWFAHMCMIERNNTRLYMRQEELMLLLLPWRWRSLRKRRVQLLQRETACTPHALVSPWLFVTWYCLHHVLDAMGLYRFLDLAFVSCGEMFAWMNWSVDKGVMFSICILFPEINITSNMWEVYMQFLLKLDGTCLVVMCDEDDCSMDDWESDVLLSLGTAKSVVQPYSMIGDNSLHDIYCIHHQFYIQ